MSFPAPTTQVSTANLDSGTDNPSLARADLLQAVTVLNEIVAGQNDINGVLTLDGFGKVPYNRLPQNIAWTGAGNQVIAPQNGVVEIQSVLRLSPLLKVEVQAIDTSTIASGCIAYCSDITTSTSGLVIWDGSVWNTIEFTGTLA